jgi:Lrp/AsnC family transcriptional regulator for asnA, asnC and gidA
MKVDAPLAGVRSVASPSAAPVSLDATDLALLRLLASDARISQRQLAQRLGVSAPTVADRMARLERNGVIRSYGVDVNWDSIGYGLKVYLSVTAASGFDVGDIMRRLWAIAEVEDVTLVTGRLDLIAHLRVRDHAHLRGLLLDEIWTIPGMAGTETLIGMAEMPAKAFATGLIESMERRVENADTKLEAGRSSDDADAS